MCVSVSVSSARSAASATALTVTVCGLFQVLALKVREDASGETYSVKLATEPTQTVTVTVVAPAGLTIDGTDGNSDFTNRETLTILAADWNTAQQVTVKADGDVDLGNNSFRITHEAASPDSNYAGKSKDLTVTVIEDDTGSLELSETSRTVIEGETTGQTYTCLLYTSPSPRD